MKQAIPLISIDSDLTLSKAIVLTKAVTINGNGRTITAPFGKTTNDNNAAFMVNASGVVINDLVIKGITASTLHGINSYRVTGVSLNDITVESFRSGVVVNGSSVAIKDITTRNNAWNGINVDKTGAHLTISGNNAHTEAAAIYVDDTTTGATVTDLESAYVSQHINANGVHPNDLAYTLKLPAPTGLSMTASPSNTLITNNGYTSSASVVAKWGAVTGAHHYKYTYWNDIATSPYKVSSPYVTNVTGTSAPGVFNQGEGIHHFAVSACSANNVCSPDSSVFNVTFDQTKPAGITNLSPANGSYTTSASLASIDWSDTSDAIGPISYYYESSTSSSLNPDGSFTSPAYRSAALSSSTIPTAGTPAGVYYWHARAVDAAGNSTEWTTPWKVTVDNTAPTISLTSPADGTTIPGTSITQSWESTSTDIDHYIYTSYNNATATSVRYSQNMGTATSKTATNVANATYWWRVTAVDKAGNQTTSPLWKLTVSNPIPSVSAEDFGVAWTKPSSDFEGINVGFNIRDFSTVTGISVDLYKDDEKLITNNATSSLLGLFNNGTLGASLSTPFVTNGTFVDSFCGGGECWNRGIRNWALADEPTKAVITVTGKNNIGQPTTKSATNSSFAQTVGTFRSILPKVTIPATPAVPATPASPNNESTTPTAATPATRATPATPVATRAASVADATPATDTATDAAVLGATDIASTNTTEDPSINENAVLGVADTKHAGLAWYWWTAIAATAVSIVWRIAGALRRKKQEY
ncbi:hypothetical protein B7Z00_03905 [Candidatus Saccharibacteria bacterium 32-50-10]|nr:MAG: hypothetical protein B7Z00_03905 [Candidatus Saccharibacteria bacterium 32-50-10]